MTEGSPQRRAISSTAMALVRDAWGAQGWRLPLLLGATLASAVLEGFTLAMLLPLLTVLGFGRSGADADPVSRTVIAGFASLGVPFTPASVAALLLALLALSAAVFLLQAYLATRLQADYVATWQRRFLAALVRAGWPFLRRQRAGDVVNLMAGETQRLGGAFYQTNLIITSLAFLTAQVTIASVIAPAITAAVLGLAVVLFVSTRQLMRRALSHGYGLTAAQADLHATTGELMGGIKLVKATAQEGLARTLIGRAIGQIEDLSFRSAFDVQLVRGVFEYASGAAVALLLIAGPLLLGVEIGVVILVVAMFVRLFPKVTGLRQCIQSLGMALPAFDNLRTMLVAAESAREDAQEGEQAPTSTGPASLRYERVSVHGDAGELILREVDFDVPTGHFVGVVGATGAGKTTLIDCALGLVEPATGRVIVDGMPLRDVSLAAWRRGIGYLGQDPVLFSGTLRENVVWGRQNVRDEDVVSALREAGAAFALRLRGGLDAPIAECGGSLSGGERQRIALARALVGTPRLLILDEVTSALDAGTERDVAAAIRARRGRTTILAVTHRLRSVMEADLVVVLEAGAVVEVGRPLELLGQNGRFAAMWRVQNGAISDATVEAAP